MNSTARLTAPMFSATLAATLAAALAGCVGAQIARLPDSVAAWTPGWSAGAVLPSADDEFGGLLTAVPIRSRRWTP